MEKIKASWSTLQILNFTMENDQLIIHLIICMRFLSNTYKNINQIEPACILFNQQWDIDSTYDYIGFFKNVSCSSSVCFNSTCDGTICTLIFTNTPVKIVQSGYEEPLFVYCKSCTFNIIINDSKNYYELTSNDETNLCNKHFLHCDKVDKCILNCFREITGYEEIKQYTQIFPKERCYQNSECEFIIPIKNLDEFMLGENISISNFKFK